MPLSLLESPCAWGVSAAWLVGRSAVDLARACPRAAAAMLLPLGRLIYDVLGAHDDLVATTNGSIGGYVAYVTIARVIDVVGQMTVTAATSLRAPCPRCSRFDAGGMAMLSAFSFVRLVGSTGGGMLCVFCVTNGGDVLRCSVRRSAVLPPAQTADEDVVGGAVTKETSRDKLLEGAPMRTYPPMTRLVVTNLCIARRLHGVDGPGTGLPPLPLVPPWFMPRGGARREPLATARPCILGLADLGGFPTSPAGSASTSLAPPSATLGLVSVA